MVKRWARSKNDEARINRVEINDHVREFRTHSKQLQHISVAHTRINTDEAPRKKYTRRRTYGYGTFMKCEA